MADNSGTARVIGSLNHGLTTGDAVKVTTAIKDLRAHFGNPSQVGFALKEGLLRHVGQLLALRNDQRPLKAVRLLEVAVESLVMARNPTTEMVESMRSLLTFFRHNILKPQVRVELAEPVFRAIKRASASTYRNVVLDVFKLKDFEEMVEELSGNSLQLLAETMSCLMDGAESDERVQEAIYRQASTVLAKILFVHRLKCELVRSICVKLRQFVQTKGPVEALKLFLGTQILQQVIFHPIIMLGTCKGACFTELIPLLLSLLTDDDESNSLLIRLGLLKVVRTALNHLYHQRYADGILQIVSKCLDCGQVDAILRDDLLIPLIPLVTNQEFHQQLLAVFNKFSTVTRPHHVQGLLSKSALYKELGRHLREAYGPEAVHITMRIIAKILELSDCLNQRGLVVKEMRSQNIQLVVASLNTHSDEAVRQLAEELRPRLGP